MTITRKQRHRRYIILLLIAVIAFVSYGFKTKYEAEKFYNGIQLEEVTSKVLSVTHSTSNIYTTAYQKEVEAQIQKKKKEKSYSESNPLLLYNPYGTNTGSVYYYAKTSRASYVKCTISVTGIKDYSYTLKSSGTSKHTTTHEYQVTGLVAGKTNKVTMVFYDSSKRAVARTYFYVKTPTDSQTPTITNTSTGSSKQKMSSGLFAMLGHDKTENANIYLYDNNGVSRGRIPLDAYRTDRILFIGNQMVYSYDENKIAYVNVLGKVTKTYTISGYTFHHDFIYDKKNKKIIALVNDASKDTIEDVVISIDAKTGKVKKLIDFEDYLKEMRESAVEPEGGNTYGGDELDWLHLNSLSITSNGNIVFSSREQSAIIKVTNIYQKPKIDYIIHSGSLYKGTAYEKYLLKQAGSTFTGQAGQHTITYAYDSSLSDGQYYLYMFNNNFGKSRTIPTFDWSLYTGTDIANVYDQGTKSMYYKYLVDEKKGTYKLVQSFDLPYSGIVSSVQDMGSTIAFSSGTSKTFGEYDTSGKEIKTFTYDATKYAYRVMKYSFQGFWYQ